MKKINMFLSTYYIEIIFTYLCQYVCIGIILELTIYNTIYNIYIRDDICRCQRRIWNFATTVLIFFEAPKKIIGDIFFSAAIFNILHFHF